VIFLTSVRLRDAAGWTSEPPYVYKTCMTGNGHRPLSRLYQDTQHRVVDLVVEAGDAAAATTVVPACPTWSVHDVIAHVTGVAADVLAGRLEGVTTDPWTAAQVSARRDDATSRIVAEWQDVGARFADLLDDLPGWYGAQVIADVTSHEHDVRGALGRAGARDSEGVRVGLDMLVCATLHPPVSVAGLGPIMVHAADASWLIGCDTSFGSDVAAAINTALVSATRPGPCDERAVATLTADPFELFRAVSGRRSEAQIRALGWSVDPAPYLGLFTRGPFTVPDDDLLE
jgi:hypothetical protein